MRSQPSELGTLSKTKNWTRGEGYLLIDTSIEIRTRGFRTGPKEVLEALQDPAKANSIDPASYSFRLFVQMETGDKRYVDKVNNGMWVGSGMRKGSQVIYEYVLNCVLLVYLLNLGSAYRLT